MQVLYDDFLQYAATTDASALARLANAVSALEKLQAMFHRPYQLDMKDDLLHHGFTLGYLPGSSSSTGQLCGCLVLQMLAHNCW